MSAHGFECLLDCLYLFSAPQTDRPDKNNTDNNTQDCLKNYAPLYNPFNFPAE